MPVTDEELDLWPLTVEESEQFTQFLVNCGWCGFVWAKTRDKFVFTGTKCPYCGRIKNVRWVTALVREEWDELGPKQKEP